MPGPNDYHLDAGGILQPGLGKDEPTESQRAGMKAAGAAALHAYKEELAAAGAALTEQQRALVKREQELEARERALAAAEESRPASKTKG
jgi:hypothetical protein